MDLIQSYKNLIVCRIVHVLLVITKAGNGVCMHSITSPKMILLVITKAGNGVCMHSITSPKMILLVITKAGNGVCMHSITSPKTIPCHLKFVCNPSNK